MSGYDSSGSTRPLSHLQLTADAATAEQHCELVPCSYASEPATFVLHHVPILAPSQLYNNSSSSSVQPEEKSTILQPYDNPPTSQCTANQQQFTSATATLDALDHDQDSTTKFNSNNSNTNNAFLLPPPLIRHPVEESSEVYTQQVSLDSYDRLCHVDPPPAASILSPPTNVPSGPPELIRIQPPPPCTVQLKAELEQTTQSLWHAQSSLSDPNFNNVPWPLPPGAGDGGVTMQAVSAAASIKVQEEISTAPTSSQQPQQQQPVSPASCSAEIPSSGEFVSNYFEDEFFFSVQ